MGTRGQSIITLAGDLGSGKSTVCALLEKALGWGKYSTGVIMREMAAKRGITVLEMNELADKDSAIDKEIDSVFKSLAQTSTPLLVDSRMAWHFLPASFKVRLTVNTRIAATRILNDHTRNASEQQESLDQVLAALLARQTRENVRYRSTYDVEIRNPANYDLMIDTTQVPPQSVADLIVRLSTDYFAGKKPYAYWVSPKNLLPTQALMQIDAATLAEVQGSIAARGFDILEPVDVLEHDRFYYIADGHKRVSGALKAGLPFVPVTLQDAGLRAPHAVDIPGWEITHHFSFAVRPGEAHA